MKKLPAQENKVKRAMQDIIAFEPMISTERMTNLLFEKGVRTSNGRPLDWHYVHKLREKLYREGLATLDRTKVKERMIEAQERYRLFRSQLIRIAYATEDLQKENFSKAPTFRDQIAAMNSVMRHDLKIISAEIETGVLRDDSDEKEDLQRSRPIDQATRSAIFSAIKKRFNTDDETN